MSGDAGAFDEFVDVFQGKIFRYSLAMCRQREDAEEVAQETLLKVFENFSQLEDPERVRSWVFRIARNFCLMKRRRSQFAPAEELSLDEFHPGFHGDGPSRKLDVADWSALPDTQAIRAELSGRIGQAIGELPDLYKSVILLRDVEELSTSDTAQILDISEDTVKTRLHRARLAVRKALEADVRSLVT
jgi:RNA polymerase sigma-70 factor (ECF subfamily)